jgi:hypothetical protein
MDIPGYLAWNGPCMVLKASVSDAAAKIVTGPASCGEELARDCKACGQKAERSQQYDRTCHGLPNPCGETPV